MAIATTVARFASVTKFVYQDLGAGASADYYRHRGGEWAQETNWNGQRE